MVSCPACGSNCVRETYDSTKLGPNKVEIRERITILRCLRYDCFGGSNSKSGKRRKCDVVIISKELLPR